MAYERIAAHPVRSEAISITGNGVLTRWALGSEPRKLAEVVTEYDRTWTDIAVSPSGDEFFLVNKTDRVERRRWEDLEVVGQIGCPSGTEPHRVAVSPDGGTIAVSGFGIGDYLLDATTGHIKTVLSGEPGLYVRFSPDGRWLACAENSQAGGTLFLYEIESDGKLRGRYALKAFEPSTYGLVNPVFSPDSQWITVYENYDFTYSEDPSGWFGNLLLFAVEAGEGRWISELESPDLPEELVERAEYERLLDTTNPFFGNAEIVCGMPSGKLAFFSTETGKLTREIPVASGTPITFVAVDAALKAIWVVLDGGEVTTVAAEPSQQRLPPPPPAPRNSLEVVREIDGHERSIRDLAYAPDGTRLVTVSADQTARVWDTANGQEMLTLNLGMEASTVAFSHSGALIAAAGRMLIVFDALTGQETLRIDDPALSFRQALFSPDDRFLFCRLTDRVPLLLDVRTGDIVAAFKRPSSPDMARKDAFRMQSIREERKAQEAKRLAAIPADERLELSFPSIAYTPDGQYLVAVTDEQRVEFRHAPGGPQVPHFLQQETEITFVAFSPNGRLCLTHGATAKLWDVASGRMVVEYEGIQPTIFSADGNSVAGRDDSVFGAKIWDALTGKERWRMTGHADSVSCIAFASDGKHIATGSWDRTVKIWRIPS